MALNGTQMGVWFGEQTAGSTGQYTVAHYVEINGQLDVTALQAAIRQGLAEVDTIHAQFSDADGQVNQSWVWPVQNDTFDVPVHDLTANTQTDSRTTLFSCKKRNKYLIHRFRHNAVSVVGDRNHRNTFTPERIHPDFGIRTFLACLDCIFQQVYQHLFNHGTIRINTQVYRPDRERERNSTGRIQPP